MKLRDIQKRMPMYYEMSVKPHSPALYLKGPPGMGKTTIIEALPDQLANKYPGKKFGIVVLNGANISLTTISGYLWPEEKDGIRYSQFTKPHWWKTTEGLPLEAYDGGTLFIDECDKIQGDEMKILGEAALSKMLASHKLPPGWVVMFAGNRAKDRSGSNRTFDHLINRQMIIEVDPCSDSLIEYMDEAGCLPATKVFVKNNEEMVFPDSPPEVQGPFLTPRSLVAMDRYLQLLMQVTGDKEPKFDKLTREECAGMIGKAGVEQYIVTMRLDAELPKVEDIIADPEGTDIPSRVDLQMMAIYKLAGVVDASNAQAMLTYVTRLPKEFHVNFCRSVLKRDKPLVNTPPFREWSKKNAVLVAILTQLKEG